MTTTTGITVKQQRFVEEYLLDLNATQAAIRAGYSVKTANAQAGRLIVNVSVGAAIQEAMEARSERTKVTADDVIHELSQVAFSDMATYAYWGPDGVRIKDLDSLPDGARRAVAEVSETMGKNSNTVRFMPQTR